MHSENSRIDITSVILWVTRWMICAHAWHLFNADFFHHTNFLRCANFGAEIVGQMISVDQIRFGDTKLYFSPMKQQRLHTKGTNIQKNTPATFLIQSLTLLRMDTNFTFNLPLFLREPQMISVPYESNELNGSSRQFFE